MRLLGHPPYRRDCEAPIPWRKGADARRRDFHGDGAAPRPSEPLERHREAIGAIGNHRRTLEWKAHQNPRPEPSGCSRPAKLLEADRQALSGPHRVLNGQFRARIRAWLPDLAALAFIAAAVTLFFADAISSSRVFSFHDHHFTYRPYRLVFAQMEEAGIAPLWNPFLFLGQPLHALLMQRWYPTTFLYRFLSFETAFKAHLILHYYLAAFGAYALLRRLSLSPVASAAGAISYGLGSFMVSDGHFCNSLITAAWAPWVVLSLVACARRPGPGRLALGGLVLCLGLLGGEVETLFFALVVAGTLALAEAEGPPWRRLLRVAWPFATVGVLAALLAMFQVLPTCELLSLSPRGQGLSEKERVHFSLTALTTLEMLVPKILGNPAGDVAYLGGKEWGGGKISQFPYFLSIYVGWIPLCLWACGALLRRGALPKVLGVLAVLAFLLMLGTATPVYGAVETVLPFLRAFRFSIKYFTLFSLIGAILAGMGVDALLAAHWAELDASLRRRLKALLVLASAGLAVGIGALAFQGSITEYALDRASAAGVVTAPKGSPLWKSTEGILARSADSLRDTVFLHLALLLAAVWALAGRRARRAAAFAIVVLLALDQARANLDVMRLVSPEDLLGRPPLLDALPPDAAKFRFVSRVDRQEYRPPARLGFRITEGGSWLHQHRFYREGLVASCGLEYGLRYGNICDPGSIYPVPLWELYKEIHRLGVGPAWITEYVRTGVKYVVALEPIDEPRVRLLATIRNDTNCPFLLYEVPDALPRALLVPQGRRIPDRKRLLETWLSTDFDPRREVLLDGQGVEPEGAGPLTQEVEWVADDPTDLRLRVRADRDAWLLLLDSWWPGWRATVDGAEVPIERADFLFRAVRVPAGGHEVRFVYDPPLVRWGVRISAVALLVALAGLAAGLRRARTPPAAA